MPDPVISFGVDPIAAGWQPLYDPTSGKVIGSMPPIGSQTQSGNTIASKVTAAAQKYNVDPGFALRIAHAESGLNPDATSSKGAVGPMQLMPGTAKTLGVNPHDVDQNIDGGVRYLSQLQDMFGGDHALTAAAYNAGPGAVREHGGVPPFPETQAYVAKVTGVSKPQEPPDEAFGGAKAATPPAEPPDNLFKANVPGQAAPQQTPGYQKAYNEIANNPVEKYLRSHNKTSGAQQAFENSFFNSMTMNTIPALSGAITALSHLGPNMKDYYAAGRDYQRQMMEAQNQAHPIASLSGNIAGFALSPATKALAVAAPAKIAAALPATNAARYGLSALGAGATGAAAGAGQAVSEGQAPADIAKSAAINAAVSAPFGPLGELAEGAGALAKTPAVKALAPVAAHAALGGLGFGGLTYLQSHNLKAASTAAGIGAAMGAGGKVVGLREAQKGLPEVTEADRFAALNHIGNVVGEGNPETAAAHIETSPGQSTVEALRPEHRQQIMQTAGELNPANLGPANEVVAARQHPQAVKARLKGAIGEHGEGTLSDDLNSATGVNPAEAEMSWADNIRQQHIANSDLWNKVETNAPVETPEHAELLKEPVVAAAVKDAQRFLGPRGSAPNPNYKPPTPQKNVSELSQAELSKLVAEGFKSGELKGTSTAELQDYFNNKNGRQEAFTALADAQRDKPEMAMLKAQNALINYKSGPVYGTTLEHVGDITHRMSQRYAEQNDFFKENVADKVNKTLRWLSNPVDRARIDEGKLWELPEVKKYADEHAKLPVYNEAQRAARDAAVKLGRGDIDGAKSELQSLKTMIENGTYEKEAGKYEPGNQEPETLPTQAAWIYAKRNLAGQVSRNPLTNAALPNHEVSKVSGYKNFDINKLARDVNSANEQHFPGLSEANKASHEEFGAEEAKDQGFNIGGMGKKAESPEALAKRWEDLNDSQKEGMRHGYMQQVYRDVRANPDSAASKYSSDYHKDFQKTLFGEDGADKFQQSLYNDKLRSAIDKIRIESGNVEPKDLNHLENLLTSESEQKLQNKIYGPKKAEQIRTAIRQELENARQGKEISKFEAKPRKEGEALKPVTSAVFGAISKAGGGLAGMTHGAALGYGAAKGYEAAEFAAHTIKQGSMTPGARRALGEYLAKPKAETAQDLREAAAKKRNIQMSKSTIKDTLAKRAALGVGLTAGTAAANAFSGVDTGQ